MASKLVLFFTFFSFLHLLSVTSLEFDVGEEKGWAVPPLNDVGFYNEWASKNRFQIGDSVVFKYNNDSVMVVTEDDYDQCNSPHPISFYNNGDTVYEFDRSGAFYFMSGTSGHCVNGQQMIIRVLSPDAPPPPGQDSPPGPPEPSAAVPRARISSILIASQLVMVFLGFIFHHLY
ncbi:hypothetical protein AAC387_Pa02g0334 [Persea americana]